MILTERERELNRLANEATKAWAMTVRPGDLLHPKPLWNASERSRKLPSRVQVRKVILQQSQTGINFEVQFANGTVGVLDAGWFGGVIS
jgi:hypothetical protein